MVSHEPVPNTVGNPYWSQVSGADGLSLTIPGPITQNTYYIRCARRVGCNNFFTGESNRIDFIVNDPPEVTCTVVDGDCSNNNLGSVSVADVATWTYEWVNDADPGTVISTTASATGLVPGSYTMTVTDTETGCTASCSSTVVDVPCCNVTDPGEIGGGDVACGSIDGPITISSVADPSGGLGDLEIVWMVSHEPVPNTVGNLYWSQVSGANGLSLTIPGPITQNTYYIRCARRVGCNNFFTGESNRIDFIVNDPPEVTCTVVDGDCSNNNLGSVSVADVATWTYEWVNDADPGTVISTTASATGLVPGSYTVTVTDTETGCTASCSSTVVDVPCCNVTDPGEIGGGDVACGSIDGPITISSVADPSGGLGDLEIVWIVSNHPTPNTVNNPDWNLVPGANGLSLTIPGPITQNTYYIRCARRVGCNNFFTGESNRIDFIVNDPPEVTCTVVDGDCSNNNLGSVSVADVATWTYEWVNDADPGTVISTTASATGLVPGSYTVTVTDTETGCTASCSSTVVDVPCCNVTDPGEIGGGDVACGSIDGPITISSVADPSGGLGDLEIVWMVSHEPVPNTVGNLYWSQVSGANGLSLTIPGPITQNTYYIRCARRVGCNNFFTGESNRIDFIVNTPPVIECSSINGNCGEPGSASVSVTSGTGPYSYAWSNGATSASIDNLSPGNYSVTVTDANGCSASCSTSVGSTAPPLVDIACGSDPLLEVGGSNSVANATGCNHNYAFWSNTLLDAYGVETIGLSLMEVLLKMQEVRPYLPDLL